MTAPIGRRPLARRSNLLVDWRAEDASLLLRSGQRWTFARASPGAVVAGVGTVTMPAGLPRWSMVNSNGAGLDAVALRVDRADSPRAAETVSLATLFTLPSDLTIYIKHVPDWYATSGGVGTAHRYLWTLGGAVPNISCYRSSSAGNYVVHVDTATTDVTQSTTAPVTRTQEVCVQLQTLLTGCVVRTDVGAGYGSASTAATGFSALGTTTLYLGCAPSTGNEADSGILAFKIASGQKTMAEMRVAV